VLRLGLTVGEVGREGRGVGEPAEACVCVRVSVPVCVRLKVCMCAALGTHGG